MAANLAATKGLPLAEHVASLLAGVLGRAQAHDLVAEAGARAVGAGLPLRDVLLSVPKLEERLIGGGHHRRADRFRARAGRLPGCDGCLYRRGPRGAPVVGGPEWMTLSGPGTG